MSLSRDQAAASDFALVLGPVHDALARYGAPVTLRVHDTLMSAIGSFGNAELIARGVSRAEALGVRPAAAAAGPPRLDFYNEQGLESLAQAGAALDDLRAELTEWVGGRQLTAEHLASVDRVQAELRSQIAELDIDPTIAEGVDKLADQALAVARTGDPGATVDYYAVAIEQLREARTRADRGMQYGTFGAQRQEQEQAAAALGLPDLPWWKWLALGLALGALVVGAVLCFFFPLVACWIFMDPAILIAAVGFIIAVFC